MLITSELENYLKKVRTALDKHIINISSDTKEINEYAEILRKWTPGNYVVGDVRVYDGIPYKCIQAHTSQANWKPSIDTASLWSRIDVEHAGTLEDPIIVPDDVTTNAFTYVIGKYYKWNGQVYKCERQGEVEGTEHSFSYSPDQLIGNYFTLVI